MAIDPMTALALLQLGTEEAGRKYGNIQQTGQALRRGDYGEVGKGFVRHLLPFGLGESIFPQESPAERAARQQLAYRQQLIRQLQPQAAGMPSPASRAGEAALRQATNRYMQAYGATARQQGISGTPVAMAQQGRMAAASQQAGVQLRGQLATSAQQQIGALTQGALQTQIDLENQEYAAKNTFYSSLSELFGRKMGGTLDPEILEKLDEMIELNRAIALSAGGQRRPEDFLGQSPAQTATLLGG